MRDSVTWIIGGEAGFGIMSAGTVFARTFTRNGYHVFAVNDYPSLIRGGHNVVTVRIGTSPFHGVTKDLDIVVALNAETVDRHKAQLAENAIIVFDPRDKEWKQEDFSQPIHLLPIPLRDMVGQFHTDTVMRNTILLGASVALLGTPFEAFQHVVHDQFIRKGADVVDQNVKIARAGYDYVLEHYKNLTHFHLSPGLVSEKQLVVNGSEAVGLGAVRAGLKFAAVYPMTPINALISFLADHAKELGVVYKQPEDEIAGINMAIGASIAGVRSMVATSGGGFALMVEGLSLAGMVEAPLVIDLGMRVGPATGMPTYTEQSELLFAVHAGHGEFPRIILAPSDALEAYELTTKAFNLADQFQVPVFIMTDKYLNESQWCVPLSRFEQPVPVDRGKLVTGDTKTADFQRYDTASSDGVSARSIPGTKHGQYWANSYEHDGTGHMTEDSGKRRAMVEKRLRKTQAIQAQAFPPEYLGEKDAGIIFVTWGTTKGAVMGALELLQKQGKNAAAVTFPWIYPFPVEATKSLLGKAKRIIDVEQNATGQLTQLLRVEAGIEVTDTFLKYDGRPWFPEEIVALCQQ